MPRKRFTHDFEDMAGPLVEALRFAYSFRRKNKGKDIPYEGIDLKTCRLLAGMGGVKETLTADSLEYHEERDRDALYMILGCVLRLGMEQGFRMLMDDYYMREMDLRSIERYLNGNFAPESAESYREMAQLCLDSLREHLRDPGLILRDEDSSEEE
jgi:hypothetical protein